MAVSLGLKPKAICPDPFRISSWPRWNRQSLAFQNSWGQQFYNFAALSLAAVSQSVSNRGMHTKAFYGPSAVAVLLLLVGFTMTLAELVSIQGREFTIPDGFTLEVAVAPELTQRPIVVDFDDLGNLYVAESSGTNDNVQKQLVDKPHSILKLSDTDGDGTFDQRTVFADRMMFPEGVLWHAGSLYVSAPPHIWKLTDTDSDGVADQRDIWFDAKTLTGCANDLHGPHLGPDGWIYWCKGAFAEQTYERPAGPPFVTRAAHIFRRRPEGGLVEPVMTGGMDNPVEVVFSEAGERFFTTTFFQHPAHGRRDGLVHAVYGGVYGKPHGVLDGHPRTGDLMPVMTHLGAAAPCGFARLESDALGLENHLISACFNLHSVQSHRLVPHGATFSTEDAELVVTEDIDFHPTDVIEDADGSLLIVDTGGWYKLCCPTSQLHKPEVLGTIYRLRHKHSHRPDDARGETIDWQDSEPARFVDLLGDPRFIVRRRALARLSQLSEKSLPVLREVIEGATTESSTTSTTLAAATSRAQRRIRQAVWATCRIDHPTARELVRMALQSYDPDVRQIAAHGASVWRDRLATDDLHRLLQDQNVAVRRAAAEALGRTGDEESVQHLFSALDDLQDPSDRVLEHSLIYALIEMNSPEAVKKGFDSKSPAVVRAALLAAGAMSDISLTEVEICRFLARDDSDEAGHAAVHRIITQLAAKHPQWGTSYVAVLRSKPLNATTARRACELARSDSVRDQILRWLDSDSVTDAFKIALIHELSREDFADVWDDTLNRLLSAGSTPVVSAAVHKIASAATQASQRLQPRLLGIAKSDELDASTRLTALQCLTKIDDTTFDFVLSQLLSDESVLSRNQAATALSRLDLTADQLAKLADVHAQIGPLELSSTIDVFTKQTDPALGRRLIGALIDNPSAEGLTPAGITALAQQFGEPVVALAEPLLKKSAVTLEEKSTYLHRLLDELPQGDLRQGHHVFHSKKAACFACHALGYRGGQVGPDLSRIARVRTRRDLLESIIYPSASFVRSYEPLSVLTTDGIQFTGIVLDQTDQGVVLQCNATERKTIKTEDIESMTPSRVSIMPTGLEKQLSRQELADLLAFLESRK